MPSNWHLTKLTFDAGSVASVPAPAPPFTTVMVFAVASSRVIVIWSPATAPEVESVKARVAESVAAGSTRHLPCATVMVAGASVRSVPLTAWLLSSSFTTSALAAVKRVTRRSPSCLPVREMNGSVRSMVLMSSCLRHQPSIDRRAAPEGVVVIFLRDTASQLKASALASIWSSWLASGKPSSSPT